MEKDNCIDFDMSAFLITDENVDSMIVGDTCNDASCKSSDCSELLSANDIFVKNYVRSPSDAAMSYPSLLTILDMDICTRGGSEVFVRKPNLDSYGEDKMWRLHGFRNYTLNLPERVFSLVAWMTKETCGAIQAPYIGGSSEHQCSTESPFIKGSADYQYSEDDLSLLRGFDVIFNIGGKYCHMLCTTPVLGTKRPKRIARVDQEFLVPDGSPIFRIGCVYFSIVKCSDVYRCVMLYPGDISVYEDYLQLTEVYVECTSHVAGKVMYDFENTFPIRPSTTRIDVSLTSKIKPADIFKDICCNSSFDYLHTYRLLRKWLRNGRGHVLCVSRLLQWMGYNPTSECAYTCDRLVRLPMYVCRRVFDRGADCACDYTLVITSADYVTLKSNWELKRFSESCIGRCLVYEYSKKMTGKIEVGNLCDNVNYHK